MWNHAVLIVFLNPRGSPECCAFVCRLLDTSMHLHVPQRAASVQLKQLHASHTTTLVALASFVLEGDAPPEALHRVVGARIGGGRREGER